MNPLEDNLRRVLRQPQAPAGLAAKVLARLDPPRPRRMFSHLLRIAAAAGIVAVLTAAGFRYERERAERLANERAMAQVREAFRLAEEHLKPFRERIETMRSITITIPKGDPQQ